MVIYCATAKNGLKHNGFKRYCVTEAEARKSLQDVPGGAMLDMVMVIEKIKIRANDGVSPLQLLVRALNDPVGVIESVEVIMYKDKGKPISVMN